MLEWWRWVLVREKNERDLRPSEWARGWRSFLRENYVNFSLTIMFNSVMKYDINLFLTILFNSLHDIWSKILNFSLIIIIINRLHDTWNKIWTWNRKLFGLCTEVVNLSFKWFFNWKDKITVDLVWLKFKVNQITVTDY